MSKTPPRSLIVGPLITCIMLALAPSALGADRPRLGVKLALTEQPGALIMDVMVGYAAATAGLKPGDRVIVVGDREIEDVDDFRDAVIAIKEGQTLPFKVVRGGQERLIEVTLVPPREDAPGAKPPTDPDLRTELLAMMEKDQAPRKQIMQGMAPDELEKLSEQMSEIDRANRDRLKKILAERGFPTVSMVGHEGATAVFLIIQHADADPQWQASMLPVLEEQSKKGEASKSDVAYLTDRVRRAQRKPQLYGTQIYQEPGPDGTMQWVAPVVADPDNLDQRRLEMGLGSWAEYEAMMAEMQNREPFPAPRGP